MQALKNRVLWFVICLHWIVKNSIEQAEMNDSSAIRKCDTSETPMLRPTARELAGLKDQ